MIVRAVALPGTPLLVPGAAGRAVVLARTREHVLEALGELVRDAGRVVVLDAGTRRPGARRGVMRPALEAVGVDRRWWGWSPRASSEDAPAAGVASSVALLALDAAGWRGQVEVVELGAETILATAVALTREVLADPGARLVVATGTPAPASREPSTAQPDGAPTTRAFEPVRDPAPRDADLLRDTTSPGQVSPGDASGDALPGEVSPGKVLPGSPGVGAEGSIESAVLDALACAAERVVERSTGEYEQRSYEVVRFSVPAAAHVATLPG
ncbi:hypothetical protein [Oerskovia turbata]